MPDRPSAIVWLLFQPRGVSDEEMNQLYEVMEAADVVIGNRHPFFVGQSGRRGLHPW